VRVRLYGVSQPIPPPAGLVVAVLMVGCVRVAILSMRVIVVLMVMAWHVAAAGMGVAVVGGRVVAVPGVVIVFLAPFF
jgi:hypothetical protein